MAKQKGIIKLEGTIGDITFFRTQDGYLAKEVTSVDANRIATDAAFERTRENNAEFGRAGKAVKLFRSAIRPLLRDASDNRMTGRFTAQMMQVIKSDITNIRGMRTVTDGEIELVQGFECNAAAQLGAALFAPYTADIKRDTGALTVNIPAFTPITQVAAPQGATHFKIVSMGAEINFLDEAFITAAADTGILPLNGTPTEAFSLRNSITPNSTSPLFLLLGIQFFQLVNGVQYSLKDGSYNALSVISVSGKQRQGPRHG